ncbi:MAG: hypothetical protein ACFB4I_17255 [Cyanophyceae cyanobacterium]
MLNTLVSPQNQLSSSSQGVKKHVKLTEITYQRNVDSDYTERIEELEKSFSYAHNANDYWSPPELSTLYGTPLYVEASPSQQRALNHLYWMRQYSQTAATEANAVLYNQVTAGVFASLGGYDTLCQELQLETEQEYSHIHAFQRIGSKTKRALLGRSDLKTASHGRRTEQIARGIAPQQPFESLQESTFRFFTTQMLRPGHCYSQYLRELDLKGEKLPAQTTGLLGQLAPRSVQQLFTLNCGSSPFLACLFYVTRYIANLLLKNYEYRYVQYYRKLEKAGEFIPVPTAVSYYHLLDESFHTTTSQLIGKELYKDFSKPTAYEKFVANLTIYRVQKVSLNGLSGGLPAICKHDAPFMLSFYQLLQSPLFNLSAQDSLYWLERCLCQEHEGFHINLKYHQRLLSDLRRFFDGVDYLWAVNREMRLMAAGGSIEQALQNNVKAFKQFSRSMHQ